MLFKAQKKFMPKSQFFWLRQFPNFEFKIFDHNKLKSMYIVKVKEFLFKVIHNICVCGKIVFRCRITDTKKCLYCSKEIHTVEHLMWECPNFFWQGLECKLTFPLTYEHLIMGKSEIGNINDSLSIIMYIIYKIFLQDRDNFVNIPIFEYVNSFAAELNFDVCSYTLN